METIEALHAYVDVFYPKILQNTLLIRKFSHIFYISAEQINGKANFTGPDRKTAIKMLDEVKTSMTATGEAKLMKFIAANLSKIGEIQMSLTPVMEILRELIEKGRLILFSKKNSDSKRLKYFNEINDLDIFRYEYKYDACIIEPGEKFDAIAPGGIESLLSYIMSHRIFYMTGISSLKPYLRTAYSYYSICSLAGSMMGIEFEDLRKEYGELYGKEPDTLKFKNYIEALYNSDILKNVNNKINGNEKIFENFIKE
jgi:hypothetical protein